MAASRPFQLYDNTKCGQLIFVKNTTVMQRLEEARLNIEGSTSYKSVENEAFLKNSYRLGKNMVTCPSCFSAQDFDCTEMAA